MVRLQAAQMFEQVVRFMNQALAIKAEGPALPVEAPPWLSEIR